jgi:hypothetical protein
VGHVLQRALAVLGQQELDHALVEAAVGDLVAGDEVVDGAERLVVLGGGALRCLRR